jgi:hypothetical protein
LSFIPVHVDYVGIDTILQGADWDRSVPFASSMTQYDPAMTAGAVIRGAIKTPDLATTYASTALGTMTLVWTDSTHLRVRVTAVGSAALSITGAPLPYVFQGAVFQIEGKSGLTSLVDQLVEGTADMKAEVVTTVT